MESKNSEPCGIRNFEEKEKEITSLTKTTFKGAYQIYWIGLNTVKDVINLLINDASAFSGTTIGKYNLAFLLLLNRSIQHIESIRILVERGFYGDSFALIRNLMSDISMMQYLHYHPELLDLFLNEKQEDYQNNKDFKKAFNETTIEKYLVATGLAPFSSSFQVLSKASHASSFGSQLYGSKGKKNGQYHLNYGPRFQPEKALMLIDLVTGSYYELVNIILWHRYHAKEVLETEEWENIKIKLKKLKEDTEIHAEATLKTLNTLFPKTQE